MPSLLSAWDNALVQRTIRLRLRPSADQANALADTARQFTSAFNQAASMGWSAGIGNATKLHYLVYYPVKHAHPTLVSDLVNQARVKAAEAVRSALALKKLGRRFNQPHSIACPPRYNKHTYRPDWASGTLRLSTTVGRLVVPFSVPTYAAKYAGGAPDTADLIQRDGQWWLHAVVSVPAPVVSATEDVVGVDLGLAQPAVTSNNRFLGKKSWRATEGRYLKHRRALQAKGTRSAKRRLRRIRHRQQRFRRDCDHVLAKQIVATTPAGGTIAIEDLSGMRARIKTRNAPQARRVHGWSFDQLRQFVGYKAEERGVTVASVDPRATSQHCSSCGHTARNNRRSRGWFRCRACSYQTHADRNAALNIAAKYRASGSMSAAGGHSVRVPIVRGACHGAASLTRKPPDPSGAPDPIVRQHARTPG
jgi:IS605 OrfB family transposase